ncbi:hypothetical protein ASN18_2814 [Candidatus Magnetominusculus xianensis]|uniref:Uncharacterized protein n=1 Tax=Candidatus Magnetominusculus xianensis TaxID=1748249 RepID=A0ABR5SC52_9BACT|nr:hypothetical protein ASN18_2814 [Candidatus Magnetominusculus xianensis]
MCPYFEMSGKSCDTVQACSIGCFDCDNLNMCQSKTYEVCPVYVRSLFTKNVRNDPEFAAV